MGNKFGNFFLLCVAFILSGIVFFSCDNFFNGKELRQQLEEAINYANACSYKISVESTVGTGNIVKPASGETVKKVTDVFPIRFEPYTGYEFIRWTVESSELPVGENIYDYISFKNIESPETDVTLKKELGSIKIRPVTAERPTITSKTPLLNATRALRDATIQVIFDCDMDEDSIYYTENEIRNLKTELALDELDFLFTDSGRCYGYRYNGDTLFKNVTIRNDETKANINHCFNAPVFITPNMLFITAGENPPDRYIQILVTIEKGFFYKKDGKPITMSTSEKWNYQVNDKVDTNPPSIIRLNIARSDSVDAFGKSANRLEVNASNFSDLNYISGNSVFLDLEIDDDDGTMSDSFMFVCKKEFDENYVELAAGEKKIETITVPYNLYGLKDSIFNGMLNLDVLSNGVYSCYFKFFDTNENCCTYPETAPEESEPRQKYWISKDNIAPNITFPSTADLKSEKELSFSWNCSSIKDYKEAWIQYKKHGTSDYSEPIVVDKSSCSRTVGNLLGGTKYDFRVTYCDFAGNRQIIEKAVTTKPCPPKNVRLSYRAVGKASVLIYPPDVGNFTGVKFSYHASGSRVSSKNPERTVTADCVAGAEAVVIRVEGLSTNLGQKYSCKIYMYDSESGKYSEPFNFTM